MNNRNPKAKPFTAEQESMMQRAEELHTQAQILEAGVSKVLACGEFSNAVLLLECERALRLARELREEGNRVRRKVQG